MNTQSENESTATDPLPKQFGHIEFGLGNGLGIFIVYNILGVAIAIALMTTNQKNYFWLAQGIGQVLFMLLPALFFMKYSPLERRGLLRLEGHTTLGQWVAGLLGIIAIQFFVGGFSLLQEQLIPESLMSIYAEMKKHTESVYTMLLGGGGMMNIIKGLAIGGIIPAFSEEILFRGFIQRSLEQVWSPTKAIVVTGIIFGIVHFNPTDCISLMVIGIYLSILAYSTQSLALPITAHFLNNAIAIVALNIGEHNSSELPNETPLWVAGLVCTSGLAAMILAARFVIRRRMEN
jgi:membrane protease YdiL (CAAX protease family)